MTKYSLVPRDRWLEAYQWHRGFAAQNDFILPRSSNEYERFAEARQLWCALNDSGDFLGLAYFTFDANSWELGGLMVASSERGNSLGSTLARLVLGHLLFMEDPLSSGQNVILHIHVDNKNVIPLAEQVLGFRNTGEIEREWHNAKDGRPAVRAKGFEFQLVNPDSLERLADWCEREEAKRTQILFAEPWQTLRLWAAAFREMIKKL